MLAYIPIIFFANSNVDTFRGGATARLQIFLVLSTCLLYLVAAGLFSRAVWDFEQAQWNKEVGGETQEFGAGPGSYDIDKSVWHVNVSVLCLICCPFFLSLIVY